MELGLTALLVAGFLVFLGAVVQSAVGFGLAVVASPLLYMIEPRLIPGPLLVLLVLLSFGSAWKYRAHLSMGEISSALIGRIPGIAGALWVLSRSPGRALPLLIGLGVLLTVVFSMTRIRFAPTTGRLFFAGMASGFLGTATAIGGPAMALVYQHDTPERIRANLSGFFFVGCLMSIVGLLAIGRFGMVDLVLALWFLLPTLLGFVVSGPLVSRLGPNFLRPALLALCAVAAAGVLFSALTGY
ncbi:MAG: sulfite exporter TauE/SafE family protein [Ectothiorhodospiraceae bacterium]|nr:sulfite exporter TauE/SafE family protein [Ectothiorhodospiraceae bacterium]MCH8504948.1 sulfite exporter TauE/SafE family protein [Ectothiorhodospiraceae bacterium]